MSSSGRPDERTDKRKFQSSYHRNYPRWQDRNNSYSNANIPPSSSSNTNINPAINSTTNNNGNDYYDSNYYGYYSRYNYSNKYYNQYNNNSNYYKNDYRRKNDRYKDNLKDIRYPNPSSNYHQYSAPNSAVSSETGWKRNIPPNSAPPAYTSKFYDERNTSSLSNDLKRKEGLNIEGSDQAGDDDDETYEDENDVEIENKIKYDEDLKLKQTKEPIELEIELRDIEDDDYSPPDDLSSFKETLDNSDEKMDHVDLNQIETENKLDISEENLGDDMDVDGKQQDTELEPELSKIVSLKIPSRISTPSFPDFNDIIPNEPTSNGCIYPLNKLETKLYELKKKYSITRKFMNHPLKLNYLFIKPIQKLSNYPFYNKNFLIHKQYYSEKLIRNISIIKRKLYIKRLKLIHEYNNRTENYIIRCEKMEEQLSFIHSKDDEIIKELESINSNNNNNQHTSNNNTHSRRSRHHGDSVRTEAEFLEILKSLEKEQEMDPLYKSEQVAAQIPNLIIDPIAKKSIVFMDANNIVVDKMNWSKRIISDNVNNFTEKEHALFIEAFLSFPKRFGKISQIMGGLRTPEECVIHYYQTKKTISNYKQLIINKNKKSGRKNMSKSTKLKVKTVEAENGDKKVRSPIENIVPVELSEELFTETGRRKRAAAPIFDSDKVVIEAKKDHEIVNEPPKKKGRKKRDMELNERKEIEAENVVENTDSVEKQEISESVPTVEDVVLAAPIIEGNIQESVNEPIVEESKNQFLQLQPQPQPQPQPQDSKNQWITDISEDDDLANSKKKHISSYWSVSDINMFPILLNKYGSKWSLIAEKLNTKTSVMVRNYFLRNGSKEGWVEIVKLADIKNGNYQETTPLMSPIVQSSQNIIPLHIGLNLNQTTGGNLQFQNGKEPPSMSWFVDKKDEVSSIPMGTFYNNTPITSYKTSIGSMLNNPAPIISRPYPTINSMGLDKPPVSRTSIMSLLNNDSSPIKKEIEESDYPTQFEPIMLQNLNNYKSNIDSLLNAADSVQNESQDQFIAVRKNEGLDALVSAAALPPIESKKSISGEFKFPSSSNTTSYPNILNSSSSDNKG